MGKALGKEAVVEGYVKEITACLHGLRNMACVIANACLLTDERKSVDKKGKRHLIHGFLLLVFVPQKGSMLFEIIRGKL